MRRQLPGARRRSVAKGLLKPQHRMVLGLVSMSAAALMLSLMYKKDDRAGGGVPAGASTESRVRAAVPLPTGRPPATTDATDAAISAAVDAARPGIVSCTQAFGPDLAPWAGRSTHIEVQLGADGLGRADVLDMKGAPAPFLGCLGAGLGTVDWPTSSDGLLLVRVPVFVPAVPKVVPLGG